MRTHIFATRGRIFALAGIAAGAIGLVGMADTSLAALRTGNPNLVAQLQNPEQDYIDFNGDFNSLTPLSATDPVGQPVLRFGGGIANYGGPFEVFKAAATNPISPPAIEQIIYGAIPASADASNAAPTGSTQQALSGATAQFGYDGQQRWTLDNVAQYSLYNADKSINLIGAKTSFCLDDADSVGGNSNGGYPTPGPPTPLFVNPGQTSDATNNWCANNSTAETTKPSGQYTETAAWGISGGDTVALGLHGFEGNWASTTNRRGWINLNPSNAIPVVAIPAGTYTLQNQVDPNNIFTKTEFVVPSGPANPADNLIATRSEGVPGPQAQPATATVVSGQTVTITLPAPAIVNPTVPVKLLPTDLFPYPTYATRLANGYAHRGATGAITPIYDIVTGPAHGTLGSVADGDNVFTYTPAPGFSGIDTFTYKTRDDHGFHVDTPATVTINVTPAPVPPGPGPSPTPTPTPTPTVTPTPTPSPTVLKVTSARLVGKTSKGMKLRLVFDTTGITRIAIQRRVGKRYVYLTRLRTFHTRSVTILVPYGKGRMVVRALVVSGKTKRVTRTFLIPGRPAAHHLRHHARRHHVVRHHVVRHHH